MKGSPQAFATFDLGAATNAVALIGRVGARWRLLGSLAGPVAAPAGLLLGLLAERVRAADPELMEAAGLSPASALDLPRLIARSREPGTVAVLAASERALALLTSVVARSGWRWVGASSDRQDPQAMTALLLDRTVSAVVVAVGDPPGGDERGAVADLGAIAGAAAQRRPELTVILAGAMANARAAFGLPPLRGERGERRGESAAGQREAVGDDPAGEVPVRARILIGPRAAPGAPAWSGLTDLLSELGRDRADSRHGIAASAVGLAGALDRRVELVEIGLNGGLRATGVPGPAAGSGTGFAVSSADACLVPPEIDEARLERVQGWSTLAFDRHRLRDRLIELRAAPWSGITGVGAHLRSSPRAPRSPASWS